eukprot:sb/3466949/
MFNLTWQYSGSDGIPASEFLIEFQQEDGTTEKEVTVDRWDLLPLRSNTTYKISVRAVNSVGYSRVASETLIYTTPYFEYDKHNHGKYDFARWFFQSSTVSLEGSDVYFKNTVRRDIRILRTVLMIDTDHPDLDLSAIYHAARFDQSYQTNHLQGPYITASFSVTRLEPLPRKVSLGDGLKYGGFLNGFLERGHVYQVYSIVWYKSGNDTDVSVRHLGDLTLSNFPWMMFFISFAVGATVLNLVSTIVNWLTHDIVMAVKKRKMREIVRGKGGNSIQELMVESVYMEHILKDPNYDMTEGGEKSVERVQSTFSIVR